MNLTKKQKIDLILFYSNKQNKHFMMKESHLPTDESVLDDFVKVLITNDTYSQWIKESRSNRLKMINEKIN